MTAFAPGRARLTFGYGSTRSDRSWSRERLESARNGQPTRSDTRSARERQMPPTLTAENLVRRITAERPRRRARRIRHPAGAGGRDRVGCPQALRS
jgi:hypothetical protein